MRTIRAISVSLFAVSVASLAACTSGTSGEAEVSVVHTATSQETAFLKNQEPLAGKEAVLYVNGLGCPLCATNIDKQLERLRGVDAIRVDLDTGTATLALSQKPDAQHPTPTMINKAVADAGFTLIKIETK